MLSHCNKSIAFPPVQTRLHLFYDLPFPLTPDIIIVVVVCVCEPTHQQQHPNDGAIDPFPGEGFTNFET